MDQLEEWITYVFDRPVVERGWYWSEDAPVRQDAPEDVPALIAETLEHGAELLARFSDNNWIRGSGFWWETLLRASRIRSWMRRSLCLPVSAH
jgi:hypothetical protein